MIQGNFRYFAHAFKHFVGDLQGRVLMDYTKEFKTTGIITPILTRRKYSCVYQVFYFFFLKLLAITHVFTDFLLDSLFKKLFCSLFRLCSFWLQWKRRARQEREGGRWQKPCCLPWLTDSSKGRLGETGNPKSPYLFTSLVLTRCAKTGKSRRAACSWSKSHVNMYSCILVLVAHTTVHSCFSNIKQNKTKHTEQILMDQPMQQMDKSKILPCLPIFL